METVLVRQLAGQVVGNGNSSSETTSRTSSDIETVLARQLVGQVVRHENSTSETTSRTSGETCKQ